MISQLIIEALVSLLVGSLVGLLVRYFFKGKREILKQKNPSSVKGVVLVHKTTPTTSLKKTRYPDGAIHCVKTTPTTTKEWWE